MPTRTESIDDIRRFNRHYVPAMHLLDQHYLDTPYLTMEADVLIELSERPGLSARDLVSRLGVDKGYLSRMLGRLEGEGLLVRSPSPDDGRVKLLRLTEAGTAEADELTEAGRAVVAEVVGDASDEDYAEVARCMCRILEVMARTRDEDDAVAGDVPATHGRETHG